MLRHATVAADPESIMSRERKPNKEKRKNGIVSYSVHNEETELITKELRYISKHILSFRVNKNILGWFHSSPLRVQSPDLTICELYILIQQLLKGR